MLSAKSLGLFCNEDYVGRTDCGLVTRLNKHGYRKDRAMYRRLSRFEHLTHIINSIILPDIDALTSEISNKKHFVNVITNFSVLDI